MPQNWCEEMDPPGLCFRYKWGLIKQSGRCMTNWTGQTQSAVLVFNFLIGSDDGFCLHTN